MRVIFMGTPDIAVRTFEALVKEHEVVLAVTQPDRPKGRGGKCQFSPVKEAALLADIPVYQPQRIRNPECIEELRKYPADVMVVIAFGQILPKEILTMTPYGCINIHASLLPKYRGAAPIQWAVINGERVSGVTTMQMDEGLDTGDILLKEEIVLDGKETGGSLHDKIAVCGAGLCIKTLAMLEKGELTPVKQGESPTAYARMLDKSMGDIDWSMSAASIECLIRGLNPWPSAYTKLNGKTLKIWRAKAEAGGDAKDAGTVVLVSKKEWKIQTGDGRLSLLEVQLEGKKRMDTEAFLRGYEVLEGTVLTRNQEV